MDDGKQKWDSGHITHYHLKRDGWDVPVEVYMVRCTWCMKYEVYVWHQPVYGCQGLIQDILLGGGDVHIPYIVSY